MSRRIDEPFAPLTRSVSDLLRNLTPAANDLWAYLRQAHRPEVPFIVRLKEAASDLGYSVRWLGRALGELCSVGLVKKLDQWWGQSYRLVLEVIETQRSSTADEKNVHKNGDRCHQTSNLAPSNVHSTVPIPIDLEEIDHGFGEDRKKSWCELGKLSQPRAEAIAPLPQKSTVTEADRLYQEACRVAPTFNPKVFADALTRFGHARICNAISAIEEQIAKGNTRNPAAALYAAIFRGFTANQSKRNQQQEVAIQAWHPAGVMDVFVAPQEERSRLEQEAERREAEFRQSVQMRAVEDVSQLLVEISIALRESGMSREQVRELLEERYRVRSQQMLKTEQLRDWLGFLRTTSGRKTAI